jgi:hypothetical protein
MKRAMTATNGMIPRNITYNAVIMSWRAVQPKKQKKEKITNRQHTGRI